MGATPLVPLMVWLRPISVSSARLLNLRENRDGTLIDLARLPRKVRLCLQIAYSIYAVLLAGFILAAAIMAIFEAAVS